MAVSALQQKTTHRGPCLASLNGYDVIACTDCGFAHVVPLPVPETLTTVYQEDYYTQEKPAYLAHAREDAQWASLGYDDQLALIAEYSARAERRLLDIGCGPGFFLQRAQSQGWTVEGIEPSRQAANHARGLGIAVRNAFFSDSLLTELESFPAIRMMNVLEHIPDPLAFLHRATSLLPKGGVLLAGVPNDFNPVQMLLRQKREVAPWWVAPPHHLNYLNFESLEHILKAVGLTPRGRLTSFPMELFIALGENYIGDPQLGRACHLQRKALDLDLEESAPGKRRALYTALAQAGFGREAIVLAVKN